MNSEVSALCIKIFRAETSREGPPLNHTLHASTGEKGRTASSGHFLSPDLTERIAGA